MNRPISTKFAHRLQQGALVEQILAQQRHKLLLVVLKELWNVLRVETKEDFAHQVQRVEEHFERIRIIAVLCNERVRVLSSQ
jgi:hypothetical protein